MRLRRHKELVSLLAALLAGGVVSAYLLMEQTQPAVPVSSQLTPNCSPKTSPTPTTVVLGTTGSMTFSCNSGAPTSNPAFTTSADVSATPTLTGYGPPYNASRLYIYDADGNPNTGWCYQRAGNLKITSGVKITIPANGWNYCAEYEDVGPAGLPEFTVSWSI